MVLCSLSEFQFSPDDSYSPAGETPRQASAQTVAQRINERPNQKEAEGHPPERHVGRWAHDFLHTGDVY